MLRIFLRFVNALLIDSQPSTLCKCVGEAWREGCLRQQIQHGNMRDAQNHIPNPNKVDIVRLPQVDITRLERLFLCGCNAIHVQLKCSIYSISASEDLERAACLRSRRKIGVLR